MSFSYESLIIWQYWTGSRTCSIGRLLVAPCCLWQWQRKSGASSAQPSTGFHEQVALPGLSLLQRHCLEHPTWPADASGLFESRTCLSSSLLEVSVAWQLPRICLLQRSCCRWLSSQLDFRGALHVCGRRFAIDSNKVNDWSVFKEDVHLRWPSAVSFEEISAPVRIVDPTCNCLV